MSLSVEITLTRFTRALYNRARRRRIVDARQKAVAMILLRTLILGLALLAVPAGPIAAIELKLTSSAAPESMAHRSVEEFVRRVNARMLAEATIEPVPMGKFGETEDKATEALRFGDLDLFQASTILPRIAPEFGIFDLPFVFKDRAQVRCFTEEILWPVLAPGLEERRYKLVAVFEDGFRQITTDRRAVIRPTDFKGLRIGMTQDWARSSMFRIWGARSVPTRANEMLLSLKTGLIDGQDGPLAEIDRLKLHEAQRYLTITNHIYTPSFLLASTRKFERYPEAVQKALLEEGRAVQAWGLAQGDEEDAQARERLVGSGMELQSIERDAFVRASMPLHDQYRSTVQGGRKLWYKIADLLEKGCR